jgi:hypothetical protein
VAASRRNVRLPARCRILGVQRYEVIVASIEGGGYLMITWATGRLLLGGAPPNTRAFLP